MQAMGRRRGGSRGGRRMHAQCGRSGRQLSSHRQIESKQLSIGTRPSEYTLKSVIAAKTWIGAPLGSNASHRLMRSKGGGLGTRGQSPFKEERERKRDIGQGSEHCRGAGRPIKSSSLLRATAASKSLGSHGHLVGEGRMRYRG